MTNQTSKFYVVNRNINYSCATIYRTLTPPGCDVASPRSPAKCSSFVSSSSEFKRQSVQSRACSGRCTSKYGSRQVSQPQSTATGKHVTSVSGVPRRTAPIAGMVGHHIVATL